MMPTTEQERARALATCRFSKGVEHGQCGKGVRSEDVRVPSGTGAIFPCFSHPELPCAHREFVTAQEVDREFRAVMKWVKMHFAIIATGRCPICGRAMSKKQVGSCVYADPCGHRLYQGTA